MDIFESDLYKLNRQYLSLCGMWPYDESQINNLVKKYIVNVSLIIVVIIQVLKFFTSPYTMDSIIDILTHFLPTLCAIASYLTYYINIENIKILLEEIKHNWSKITSKTEEDIMREYAKKSRMFTLVLMTTYNTTIFSTMFLSTVPVIMDIVLPLNETRTRKLPVQVECFLDPDVHFIEILALTYVLMTIQGIAAVSTWTAYVMIIQHICGMFRLTGHVMEHAFDRNRSGIQADKARARWIRGIKLHKKTIKLLDLINLIIEHTTLIEVGLAVVLFGIDFVRIFKTDMTIHNFMTSIINVTFFVGHFSYMFLTCHIGQKVLDHSSDIFEKACGTSWYFAPREVQQLILLVIMRTMKPSYLSIGRIFVSSYELFAGIIRMSMSYATVFYSIQ